MISYKRLWVLLAEKELNKKKLMEMTGIGTSSMAKLTKGANVTTDILCRICKALKCDFPPSFPASVARVRLDLAVYAGFSCGFTQRRTFTAGT